MRVPVIRSAWSAILLCVVVADANFWIYAAIGTNEGDFLGFGFFSLCAADALGALFSGFDLPALLSLLGSLAAAALMAARESGVFDRGYLLPYAVLLAFLLAAAILPRRDRGPDTPPPDSAHGGLP